MGLTDSGLHKLPPGSRRRAASRIPFAVLICLRIPMMSISQSDLMPIRSERSDARLSQCESSFVRFETLRPVRYGGQTQTAFATGQNTNSFSCQTRPFHHLGLETEITERIYTNFYVSD
jgi:hypothetical protein